MRRLQQHFTVKGVCLGVAWRSRIGREWRIAKLWDE